MALFGSAKPQSSGGLFGNTSTSGGSSSGGLFGNTSGTNSTGVTGSTNQPATGFGAGSTATSGGLFGNTTTNTSSGGLFGNNNNTSTSGGLFGNKSTTSSGGLFGNNNTSSSGGLFGNNNSSSTSGGLFGNSNNNSTSGGLFGNSSNNNQTNLPNPRHQAQQDEQSQTNMIQNFMFLFSFNQASSLVYNKKLAPAATPQQNDAEESLKKGHIPELLARDLFDLNEQISNTRNVLSEISNTNLSDLDTITHLNVELERNLNLARSDLATTQDVTDEVFHESRALAQITQSMLHEVRRCSSYSIFGEAGRNSVDVAGRKLPSEYIEHLLKKLEVVFEALVNNRNKVDAARKSLEANKSRPVQKLKLSVLLQNHHDQFMIAARNVASLDAEMDKLRQSFVSHFKQDIFNEYNKEQQISQEKLRQQVEQDARSADLKTLMGSSSVQLASTPASNAQTPASAPSSNLTSLFNAKPGTSTQGTGSGTGNAPAGSTSGSLFNTKTSTSSLFGSSAPAQGGSPKKKVFFS